MQRKKGYFVKNILAVFFFCLILPSTQAANPLWTFVPLTPTDITVTKAGNAQVIYAVKNQSLRAKVLVMTPIPGVSQSTPCNPPSQGQCILTLNVNGSALNADVIGGPVLCEQGNPNQCYQPNPANMLRIKVLNEPPSVQYTITPTSGPNGSIVPSAVQRVLPGSNLTFMAVPSPEFDVEQWRVDGSVVQSGGISYQLTNIQANHEVHVSFKQKTMPYAAAGFYSDGSTQYPMLAQSADGGLLPGLIR